MTRHLQALVPALALLSTLAACASSVPIHYYLLEAKPPAGGLPAAGISSIGVRPIDMPDYLDRAEIVTRGSDNRLEVNDLDRWGETLDALATRTLAADLRGALHTASVVVLPTDLQPEPLRRLTVEVDRFEADAGNVVTLAGRWQLVDASERPTSGSPFLIKQAISTGPLGDTSQKGAMATAMSEALATLAAQIAASAR
ncbi:hypothetical protein SAMN07250955_103296 [Arboricoccus pini]|uniref:ABC-type transport auxiliary lipoprotein component domain-containing protein n=1 Tax=Arboricoccus pini TaxID=1963835 RepID=A0A212QU96_9PROT|nr:PqiC family protein [Arboricoccus pini]SNB63264.1 hypothetical protein SAMN07250955_103296 [Arboricoccus pini]